MSQRLNKAYLPSAIATNRPLFPIYLTSLPLANNHSNSINDLSPQDKAKNAAQRWIKTIEEKSSLALLCPNCNSTTPKAELERWNLCYHCAAQKWAKEYRFPTFPVTE